jgi:hypothetical protein
VHNQADLEGYLDRPSYFPGESMALRVHSLHGAWSFSLLHLGGSEHPLAVAEGLPGGPQDYRTDAYAQGAHWKTSFVYKLPSGLPSGLYAVKLAAVPSRHHKYNYYIPFVVKGRKGGSLPPIIVMANTLTWQAYNSWGGGSFYKGNPRNPEDSLEPLLSFDRPSESTRHDSPKGHTGCAERHTSAFLLQNGYRCHWMTDRDLQDDPGLLDGYRILVIHTHAEYWTSEMIDRVEAFLKGGGCVLNISGNVMYWKVTLRGDQVECQKFGGIHVQSGEKGGRWLHLGRPSEPLLGVGSDPRGIHTFAPFQVVDASHWLLRGTGLENGDVIGAQGLNEGGGSGWETDKLGPGAPASAALLARGLNPGHGGADVVYFETSQGGAVLSAGSISFPGSLVLDEDLQVLVRHFLDAWQGGGRSGPKGMACLPSGLGREHGDGANDEGMPDRGAAGHGRAGPDRARLRADPHRLPGG